MNRLTGKSDVLIGIASIEPAAAEIAFAGRIILETDISGLHVLTLAQISRFVGPAGLGMRRLLGKPTPLIEIHAHRGF